MGVGVSGYTAGYDTRLFDTAAARRAACFANGGRGYAPFVAAFELSFRDGTAWTPLVVPNATAANDEKFNRTTSGS